MSKKLATFLCILTLFWGTPQANQASAALSTCQEAEVSLVISYVLKGENYSRPAEKNVIPAGATQIQFEFNGPSQLDDTKFYRLDISWDQFLTGYRGSGSTNFAKPTEGKVILITNNDEILKNNSYIGTLKKDVGAKGDGTGPYGNVCDGINFSVGETYSKKTCNMILSPSGSNSDPIQTGQTVTANVVQALPGTYSIIPIGWGREAAQKFKKVTIDPSGKASFNFTVPDQPLTDKPDQRVGIELSYGELPSAHTTFCDTYFSTKLTTQPPTKAHCTMIPDKDHITVMDNPKIEATNLTAGVYYWARLVNEDTGESKDLPDRNMATAPERKVTLNLSPTGSLPEGKYAAQVLSDSAIEQCPLVKFKVGSPTSNPDPVVKKCGDKDEKGNIITCTTGGGKEITGCSINSKDNPGIATAIGCIRTNPPELVKSFMTFTVGIGGGLAFLMMLLGAFQMLTSAGNPETLNAGKDRLTNAVIGLLFIIFAVLLLQIIGVDILKIPGFDR